MAIKFVTGYPAAFITDEKILVIADIQIGLEHELYKKGIVIHAQVDKFLENLNHMIKITKAKKLVVLGDLKHKVPGISLREESQLLKFCAALKGKVKIILVKGNHDTGLKGLLPPEVEVHESGGVRVGKYGFFHGHAWPAKDLIKCDHLFMGHLQPGIEFRDHIGYRTVEQVWLKADLDKKVIKKHYKTEDIGEMELIIVPAFNRLLGSAPVNRMEKGDFMGPFANGALDLGESKAYLLDGTFVGVVGKIDI
jgi:putative SbcD/Mre11-related phosphoesterase